MSVNDLVTWFKGRPKWIQEAVNRLLEKDDLSEQVIIELAELCKNEAVGELDISEYTLPNHAFGVAQTNTLHLCSISSVQGINALAPQKPLDFGKGNLAVVYGQNGSGKSGYVRILKHACGARFVGMLHPNVYLSAPTQQKCLISYGHDGLQANIDWEVENGVIDHLRSVDIFDAYCGHVYVTKENEVSYEPPVLSFFSELIDVCEKVSRMLNDEKSKLLSKKPTLPVEYNSTSSGQWYAKLSNRITPGDTTKHCEWTDIDENKLAEFQNRLAEPDPAEKAKQLRKQQQHVETLIKDTEKLLKQLFDENCRRIIDLKKKALVKREAAEVAAKQAFSRAPLDGIGSEVWRQLWEQARKYSQEEAYKDRAHSQKVGHVAIMDSEEIAICFNRFQRPAL
jgi:energy-coupling factor transporter ATP-binding protein EcfA2